MLLRNQSPIGCFDMRILVEDKGDVWQVDVDEFIINEFGVYLRPDQLNCAVLNIKDVTGREMDLCMTKVN